MRRPRVLLLEERTEGVDARVARHVLAGARTWLPDATLVIALHNRLRDRLPWAPDALVALAAVRLRARRRARRPQRLPP